MEKIILGLLMLKRLTIYEMRLLIKRNFQSICSDSMGSIQAAVKKLLAGDMITCDEFIEKSVNKKLYSITDLGREYFLEWIKTPADMTKGKNMELGKVLFMGLVPAKERMPLIDQMIVKLKKELSYLEDIYANMQAADEKAQIIAYLKQDPEYLLGIQNSTDNASLEENVDEIGAFEMLTLQLGIDSTKFYISWLEALKYKLENGEV